MSDFDSNFNAITGDLRQIESGIHDLQSKLTCADALAEAARVALLHLDASVCECGFPLKETDAADTLRNALAAYREE